MMRYALRAACLAAALWLASLVGSAAQQLPMRVTAGGITGNPTSVLTRPNNANAYSQNQLIASSTTAGSIVVPSFLATGCQLQSCAQSAILRRLRLITNATSGMGSVTFTIELWSAAPNFTNGDGGSYAVATGAAGWLGAFTVSSFTQVGDGAYGVATPSVGSDVSFRLPSGTAVYWSLQVTNSGGFTPIANQTFTLIAEALQDD
jgi:hypothetical protein